MQLRQCAFPTARQPGFDRAAGIIERIEDGGLIVLAGAAEHVIEHQVLVARMADADAQAQIIRAEHLVNVAQAVVRSEEHTSELQSLMRLSYAVFCFNKKTYQRRHTSTSINSDT